MKIRSILSMLCISTISAFAPEVRAQEDPLISDQLLGRLPELYRERAREFRVPVRTQEYYQTAPEASVLSMVASYISRQPDGIPFLLQAAERESSPQRRATALSYAASSRLAVAYFNEHPGAVSIFEKCAATDPDAEAARRVLSSLRRLRRDQQAQLLRQRIKIARAAGDQKGLEELSEEESRYYKWFGEVAMPASLRDAPPVFSVVSQDKPIRIVAFGDFGTGQPAQVKTAQALQGYAKQHPFDFGITLGDNFYPVGMETPSDPRWQTQWERLYKPLGIKFYASLGNHDYGQASSPLSELLYSEKSSSWTMPARYYSFTAGSAQFFQVDTVDLSERQLRWLDEQLAQSKATWKVVYGHYQIYSATRGDNDEEQSDLINTLLPILKKRNVNLYICGHDHNLQILKPEGTVNFVVAGGGGAGLYEFNQKDYDRNTFKEKTNGFAVIEADRNTLTVRLVNSENKELSSLVLKK